LYAANYEIKKVTDNVYAAVAIPGGKIASNAMFVVTEYDVILAGAHFVPEGISELLAEIRKITPMPVTRVVLTHHHNGFNYVDFDLPEKTEIVASLQIWQSLKGELREFRNPTIVFENSLTLNRGPVSLVLMNTGRGHSNGDVVIYMPKEGILFASDLFFNETSGYMGDAFVHDWGESLEILEGIDARVVIPGLGKVADADALAGFRRFFKAFMTETLRNIEKGNTLAQTKKEFSLDQYKQMPGFATFFEVNLERAYKQLKSRE
jgi:glyoxylase-like metal-dependent hydrolase (beta-lactamase superfamily II)